MFGTDLPSTRAPRPYSPADLRLVLDTFEETQAQQILYGNAMRFYRFDPTNRGVAETRRGL